MGNNFDFELRASDEVTATIQGLEDVVKKMLPDLDKARDKLGLGGQKSVDGLGKINGQMASLGQYAKQSVQFVGDIVPPLKMVSGLTLGLGGAALAVNAVKNNLEAFASTGYRIETTANNISMTTQAFQALTGAMVENGSAREAAESSVSSLYEKANDAVHGRNDAVLAILKQAGIGIGETREGLADVDKLVKDLNRHMQTLSPGEQALLANKLGLSPELLSLLRNSTDGVQRLKDQAQRDGLVFSDKDIQNALAFNQQINGITAAFEGMSMQTQAWLGQSSLMKNTVEELKQISQHGMDGVTVGNLLGYNAGGEQADLMRKGKDDPDFKNTLNFKEKADLSLGYFSADLKKKIDAYYGPVMQAEQLQADMNVINTPARAGGQPAKPVNPNSRPMRNNNFWDLNYAGQKNARLEEGTGNGVDKPRFAHFSTPQAGVKGADRQLMLYFNGNSKAAHHQKLMTLHDIISVASPRADQNNIANMIAGASNELGVSANTPLNLNDPALRARVLHALFDQESGSPYSTPQIQQIIQQQPAPPAPSPVMPVAKGPESPTHTDGAPPAAPSVIAPLNAQRQPARGPSGGMHHPPSILAHHDAPGSAALAGARKDVSKENPGKIEITFVDGKTGARKTVSVPSGGKISTSMPY